MDTRQQIFQTYETPDPVRIKKVIKFIRKYFDGVEGLNVLDCGLSKGGVADILGKEGANCFGVDVNPREIAGVKIVRADLNDGLPGFDVGFDIIFAGEVIEHLFNERKFLRDCRNLLKPGGLLVVTVPNLVSLFNRFLMFFGQMPLTAYAAAEFHYHVYTRRKLKKLIKDEGFEILRATSSYVPLNIFSKIPGIGRFFGFLGDLFPTMGNQLIVFARKK